MMKFSIVSTLGAAALLLSVGTSANAQVSSNNFRIEGGLGYDIGTSNLNISTTGAFPATLKAGIFGTGGLSANAALWYDGAFGAPGTLPGDISIGVQYLHFGNSGSLSETAVGLGTVSTNLSLDTEAAMADIEWRKREGVIHPFVGAGVGAAFTSLSIGAGLGGFGATSLPSDNEVSFAAQGFFGFDYDITSNLYAGLTGTFFYTDADYNKLIPGGVKLNLASDKMALTAHLGWRF